MVNSKKNTSIKGGWVPMYCPLSPNQCFQPYLPHVKSNRSNILKEIECIIWIIVWVGYLRMDPLSLVVWIVNLTRFPVTLHTSKKKALIRTQSLLYTMFELTLYSGLGIIGGSHSPSMSSSQSSGILASGSAMYSG